MTPAELLQQLLKMQQQRAGAPFPYNEFETGWWFWRRQHCPKCGASHRDLHSITWDADMDLLIKKCQLCHYDWHEYCKDTDCDDDRNTALAADRTNQR